MKYEDGIMILDFSGVPMTPLEKQMVFAASVKYLQELHHGAMKFKGGDAEGVITNSGSFSWAGTSGEVFDIEFDEDRWVSFLLPSRYEEMTIPEGVVTLSRLKKPVPMLTAPRTQEKKKKKTLH